MKSKFKLNAVAVALGAALIVASAPGHAAINYFAPVTQFEDDDMEILVDLNQNGLIDVGDTLVTILEFNQTVGFPGGPSLIFPQELTGVAAITVTNKVALGGGLFNFTFGPSGVDYTGNGGLAAAGAIVALYLDNTPDLTVTGNSNCASLAACTALAVDGALWAVAGFGPSVTGNDLGIDADVYYASPASPDNTAIVAATGPATVLGGYNFALSVMFNGTGRELYEQSCFPFCGGGNGMTDVVGSGNILGGRGFTNGFFGRSDNDFTVQVPEPATLALLGMGLLGMGVSMRKRKA